MRKQISIMIRPLPIRDGQPDYEVTIKTRRSYRHAWIEVDTREVFSETIWSAITASLQLKRIEL